MSNLTRQRVRQSSASKSTKQSSKSALGSLWLGILAFLLIANVLVYPLGILAIIFGGSSLNTSKKKAAIAGMIIGTLAIAFATIIRADAFRVASDAPNETAERYARELNEETKLPQRIDDSIELTRISADGNILKYHYLLHGVDESRLSHEVINDSARSMVCEDEGTVTRLRLGLELELIYVVNGTNNSYSALITSKDC